MKQYILFGKDGPNEDELKYSSKVNAPVYEPKNKQPSILELFNNGKTSRLIKDIEAMAAFSEITEEERIFLVEAAHRHTIFHYENIADYYAHATKPMQYLMEKSGLVIIDFEGAIQNGFIKLSDSIRKQYLEEYGDDTEK
jgi:hypothetical protein